MYCTTRAGSLQVPPPRGVVGFIDPVTITTAIAALNPAQWFGRGRREADILTGDTVPKVNQFLTAAAAKLGVSVYGCGEVTDSLSAAQLAQGRSYIVQLRDAFLGFLRDSQIFPDGRASGQAATGDMPKFDGTSDYGKHASGGRVVQNAPVPHYDYFPVIGARVENGVEFTGAPVCGGLIGAIDRALAKRAQAGQSAPAPNGVAPKAGPTFVEVPAPEGTDQPWWALPWIPPATAPEATPSTGGGVVMNYGGGGGAAPGGGLDALPPVSTAGVPAAGSSLPILLLIAGGLYMVTR